ncbi:MAG: glycosyltransferase, partial [Halobacteriales archaeon]|nr:glycosyltransferase [Halobacteriales archaeon]
MRLGLFTDSYLPSIDGCVTSLLAQRAELEARGHEVHIFAPANREAQAKVRDPRVLFYDAVPWSAYPDYYLPIFPARVRNRVRERGIELIHSHGIAMMGLRAVWAAKGLKLPLVLTYHTRVDEGARYVVRPGAPEQLLRKLIWTDLRWYFRRCDAVVTPSEAIKKHLAEGAGSSLGPCVVIPNGVDFTRFHRPDSNAIERYHLEDKTLFLTAGRIAFEKNLEVLVDAMKPLLREVPDAHFVIAGKGPGRKDYENLVKREGLAEHVTFTGYVTDGELAGLYRAAHAFLTPSSFETQGMVALEAMHFGTPVVAADTGGFTDYLRHRRNGYLVEPGS